MSKPSMTEAVRVEAEHTRPPYKIHGKKPGLIVTEDEGSIIAIISGDMEGAPGATARFIVTSCNNHQQLVEACEAAEQCMADFIELYKRGCAMVAFDEAVKSMRVDGLVKVRVALTALSSQE